MVDYQGTMPSEAEQSRPLRLATGMHESCAATTLDRPARFTEALFLTADDPVEALPFRLSALRETLNMSSLDND